MLHPVLCLVPGSGESVGERDTVQNAELFGVAAVPGTFVKLCIA